MHVHMLPATGRVGNHSRRRAVAPGSHLAAPRRTIARRGRVGSYGNRVQSCRAPELTAPPRPPEGGESEARLPVRSVLARAAPLPRPRVHRHDRFHRPGQLGDQLGRRQPVRLRAALGHLALHAHADLPAARRGAPGHRHRRLACGERAQPLPAAARRAVRRHAWCRRWSPPVSPRSSAAALGFQILFPPPARDRGAAHAGARRAGHRRPALRPARTPDHRLSGLHRRRLHRRDLHRETRHGRRLPATGSCRPFPAGSIVVAMGMLGAIVMPHNIYLHSNTIQSREWDFGGDDQTQAHALRADRHVALDGHGLARELGDDPGGRRRLLRARHHGHSIQQASATLRPLVGPPRSSSSVSPCWSPACRRRSPRRWPRPTS